MADEPKGWIRASMALDTRFEAESSLLDILEHSDESYRGKLLRALVRAGFKQGGNEATATAQAVQQGGADHG